MFEFGMDRLITTRVVEPLRRVRIVRPRSAISVLMYHGVNDDAESDTPGYYRLNTGVSLFQQQMEWLHRNGFQTLGLHEVPRLLSSTSDPAVLERQVVITFDDGYKDFMENAWPAMKRYGFTGTVFLPTAYIGKETRSFRNQPCLTWDEVRELRRAGVFFGPHTVTHRELNQLPWTQAADEIKQSKQEVEDQLSETVASFSHPYGFPAADRSYVERYCALLESMRISVSVTTLLGRMRTGVDPLLIPRLPVNGVDSIPLFAAKLRGSYDWLAAPQRMFKSVKGLFAARKNEKTQHPPHIGSSKTQ